MATIDHPLLEANRVIESGFLDPASLALLHDELNARPRTPAQMREAVFEILGEGFRGCLPIAIEAVLDPETMRMGFPEVERDLWGAIGPVDDASALELEDGSWLNVDSPKAGTDRPWMLFFVEAESAMELDAQLQTGCRPVWAIPAVRCLQMGTESEYRAFMASN